MGYLIGAAVWFLLVCFLLWAMHRWRQHLDGQHIRGMDCSSVFPCRICDDRKTKRFYCEAQANEMLTDGRCRRCGNYYENHPVRYRR